MLRVTVKSVYIKLLKSRKRVEVFKVPAWCERAYYALKLRGEIEQCLKILVRGNVVGLFLAISRV